MPPSTAPRRPIRRSERGPIVSVRAVEDLVCALPHLLGFPPVESLVLVALEGPRDELTFTLRVDLPVRDEIDAVVEMCAVRMQAADADGVLAFVVTERPDPDAGQLPGIDLVEALQRGVAVPLRDAFLVRDGRVWSYLCPDQVCCPPQGRVVDDGSPTATALAAAGVVSGRPVYRDRDEIVRAARAVGGADALAMTEAVARLCGDAADDGAPPVFGAPHVLPAIAQRYDERLPALLAACAERGAEIGHDDAALLGCGWHHVDLRDRMLAAVAAGVPGADAVVRAVARLMPSPYDAPAAAMLGWVAYAEGSGVLAAAALERALATDPHYSLARLLDDALYRQVPPAELRAVWARFADDEPRRPGRTGAARRRRPAGGR
jgi:hypothetical protein